MWLELALCSWICFGYMHVLWLDHYPCYWLWIQKPAAHSFSMQTINRCENIQPRWETFWSLMLCKISMLVRMHVIPLLPSLCHLFWASTSAGMVSDVRRGNELSMGGAEHVESLQGVFWRSVFNLDQIQWCREKRLSICSGHILVVLSVCHLLFIKLKLKSWQELYMFYKHRPCLKPIKPLWTYEM